MVNKDSIASQNRKAFHEYEILEKLEAGIVLTGPEVKSIRDHKIDIKHSFIKIEDGQAYILNARIKPYSQTHYFELDPDRKRKLLLKKKEIRYLQKKIDEKGLTVIPLKVYFNSSWAKIQIALAKGKTKYDKRATLKKRDTAREIDRERKHYSG